MSNTNTITTAPRLLATFAKALDSLGLVGVSLRWEPGRKQLQAKGVQGKAMLEVRPALYPSRALIDWVPAADRAGVLVVSPHIAAALAADLRRAGLNHADLNGRFFLQAPWLLIDREPKQRVHRNPLAEPDYFAGKSSRLVRLLLRRTERGWTQAELVERTGLSRGLVSRLLATLERQALVSRERGAKRTPQVFRLRNFDGLLDSWREKDDWKKRVVIQEFSVLGRDQFEIAQQVTAGLPAADIAFTQWFAAWLRQPYATVPVVSAYVRHEELIHTFKARAVGSGGNLWLIAPRCEEALFDTQEAQGYRLVSDVQIYLDLLQVGQRGPDAAETLRQWEGFTRVMPGTYLDYRGVGTALAEQALLSVWDCLADYHEDLVLIGGLAVRFLTHPPTGTGVGPVTVDVDFGISIGASSGTFPKIEHNLAELGFRWVSGRFVRKVGGQNLFVDLLTDDGRSDTGTAVVDESLHAAIAPGIDRALTQVRTVEVAGKDLAGRLRRELVRVAEVGPMLVLKLNAFTRREDAKEGKDAHDILYLAENYLDGVQAAVTGFQQERQAGNRGTEQALHCLRLYFRDPDGDGPVACAAFRMDNRHQETTNRAASMRIRQACVTLAEALLG